ncbi:transcriptional activator protein UGA3 [Microdochium nivale]|nr:transcriptional activator protein UGA3 [Microdochium nivale]
MPKKQRVKGCFQCSARRIDCDLGQPECAKCLRKGIECSGLARIRFASGLVSRGRLKNASVPVMVSTVSRSPFEPTATTIPTGEDENAQIEPEPQMLTTAVNASNSHDDNISRQNHISLAIQPWIPLIPHRARVLYSHFSHNIAPVMVVIDGLENGYRKIILPMACNDDLLGRAVAVIASQHLGLSQPKAREAARHGRTVIIQKLRHDATVASPEAPQLVFNPSTWATLLILLVGEIVTGGPEFEHLFRMLAAAAQNCNLTEIPPVLHDFLLKQTRMFEFITRPQLSSVEGIDVISRSLDSPLDWVSSESWNPNTERSRAVVIAEQALREASELYLLRATASPAAAFPPLPNCAVFARLRCLVASLEPSAEGAHVLVWPCFIGAAESTLCADRQFFLQRLSQIYVDTKFANVPLATASLPLIWEIQDSATGDAGTSWITRLGSNLIM